jgi:hypothetical protein
MTYNLFIELAKRGTNMRYNGRKGWIASYKDTWSLQHSLSPIIGAALVKFKETITMEGEYNKGIPVEWMCAKVEEGLVSWAEEDNWSMYEEDENTCFASFIDMLDECIYAFTCEEPDISDYNFHYNSSCEEPDENGCIPFALECTNKEERDRYGMDMKLHNDKVKRGQELFGLWLNTMWW